MRIKIRFYSSSKIHLPTGYISLIQGFLYNKIDKLNSKWLHEEGFTSGGRKFRLFCFSWILERARYDRENSIFIFPENISFIVSSPVDWILEDIATNTIKSDKVKLGDNVLFISSIEVLKEKVFKNNEIVLRALTPIEVHSTFEKPNGKKITHYYTPFDSEFSEFVNNNLKKKWNAFYKEDCKYDLSIEPLFKGNRYESIIYFGTNPKTRILVKGWRGKYLCKAPSELLKFAYNTGLGSKNSQGFGMVEE